MGTEGSTKPGSAAQAADCLRGGGEMGALLRATDWSRTRVGPVESWPQSLRTAVSIVLSSRFGMYIAWGKNYTQFYNDAYRPILGVSKHPAAGKLTSETFAESWHIIGPLFDGVMRGEAVGSDDWMLPLDRNGYLEECFFTYGYSPIRDETGEPGGVLVTVSETTARVLGERRLRTLRELGVRAARAATAAEAWTSTAKVLGESAADVPFAVLYELAEGRARRIAAVNLEENSQAAPRELALGDSAPWPLQEARTHAVTVEDVVARVGEIRGPVWPEPVRQAVVLPITRSGRDAPWGFVVAGLSPRRRLDDQYRSFLGLLVDPLANALSNARALDDERLRSEQLAQRDREESARLAALFAEVPVALAVLRGPHHHVELANARYQRLAGNRKLLGLSVREAFPELEGQGFYELLDQVYATGEPFVGVEVPIRYDRGGDGRVEDALLDITYQPMLHRAGTVSGIMVVAVDVSGQVRARQAVESLAASLRESESRFRTLAEAIPQAVWTAGSDGVVDFANSLWREYYGSEDFATLAARGWDIHPDDQQTSISEFERSLREVKPYEAEFRIRRAADGVYRWHLARAVAVRDPSGNVTRWVGTNTDIHDRKEIEQVRERLIAALKSASRARDDLLAAVSHDLRNPLNVITMSSSLLERVLSSTEGSREQAKPFAQRIKRASGHMVTLVNDLLDASRIEAGALQLELKPTPAAELLEEVIEAFAPLAMEKGIELVGEDGAPAGAITADRARLFQVFSNLVGNAIKFTPRGGKISLASAQIGSIVRFEVRDSGPGIPEQHVPQIFDRYWQPRGSASREGAGLGLFIAKGIVEAHHGIISVETGPGKGSRFIFTVPSAPEQ